MNKSRSRKIAYFIGIVVCFTVIVGLNAFLKTEQTRLGFAQSSMGKINPVSGTAQLVFLGFRGIAVTFQWQKAIELKRRQQYLKIRPVYESITLLQPNFESPWQFQAWNMAYNICAEWESVDDKYYWIKEGGKFINRGCLQNQRKPDLLWYAGWIYYNRYSMADERIFLRQNFRVDPDVEYTTTRSTGKKDPFLKSTDWFGDANDVVLETKRAPKQRGITPFMSYVAMGEIQYAKSRTDEGRFEQATVEAWRAALNAWKKFGSVGEAGREAFIKRLEYSPTEFGRLTEEERYWVNRYQSIVNYNYWKQRCTAEADPIMFDARRLCWEAMQADEQGDFQKALDLYKSGFEKWVQMIKTNKFIAEDVEMSEDLQPLEQRYLMLHSKLEIPPPKVRPFEGIFGQMPTSVGTPNEVPKPVTNKPD